MRSRPDLSWGSLCFGVLGFREDEWEWKWAIEKVCWDREVERCPMRSLAAVLGKSVTAAACKSFDRRTWEGQRGPCCNGWCVMRKARQVELQSAPDLCRDWAVLDPPCVCVRSG